jgi:polyisoprenoid-binding protein YceI
MKISTRRIHRFCFLLSALMCGVANTASVAPANAQPAATSSANVGVPQFVLDPNETHARFEVKFLGFMTVRGKFNRTTGKLFHDPSRRDPDSRALDSIHADIDATTLSTHIINAESTNEMLRGPQFFNVDKFPAITFKSSVFNWDGNDLKSIDGSLTLLGTTKPVTLTVDKSGCTPADSRKRARCSAEAFVNIKRGDFGMKAWAASVSNDVKLIVELVAYKATEATESTQPPRPADIGDDIKEKTENK